MDNNPNSKRKSKFRKLVAVSSLVTLLILLSIYVLFFRDISDTGSKDIMGDTGEYITQIPDNDADIVPTSEPTNPSGVAPIQEPSGKPTDTPAVTPTPLDSAPMQVHFIDVWQGDSILIAANGHYMLIDAGQDDKGSTVVGYLNDLGVERLEYIISTHPHNDHVGGLDAVVNSFTVGEIIMPDLAYSSNELNEFMKAIEDRNLNVIEAVVGDQYTLGDATFTIVSPVSTGYEAINDYSIGIKLTYEDSSFLLTGDAHEISETEMVNSNIGLSADVLKLNHHGSSTSSSSSFLDSVNPEYAVICVGEGNKYEHPHSDTMQAMLDRGIKVFRTDAQGSIVFSTDGQNITVNTTPYEIVTSDLTPDAAEDAAKAKGY